MSATQIRSGAAAANTRSTRSPQTRTPGHPDRRPAAPAADQAADPGGAHEALHALAADPLAVAEDQLGMHARRPVDLAVVLVDLADPDGQPLVLERPLAGLACLPGVKARTADLQGAAHDRDRVLGLLRGDEPEHAHRLRSSDAKKAAAFFKFSRSSVTTRSSRRKRRSSSRSSELRPAALPSSTSSWRAQLRSDCGEQPSSRASWGTGRPLERSNRTASARNSGEYGGVFGIDRHPLRQARWPSRQMSTKAVKMSAGAP